MEQKHTPTPWRVVNGNLIKDEFMPFDRHEAETALIATAAGHTTARTEANAAFIVRACNTHDELVSALTACLKRLVADCADKSCVEIMEARAALSAAGVA